MAGASLVGRERETLALRERIDHLPDRGGALIVTGQAGIGKSALIATAGFRRAKGVGTFSRLAK